MQVFILFLLLVEGNASRRRTTSVSPVRAARVTRTANRTLVREFEMLTKPHVMSEITLSGKSDAVGIERILFPASFSRLPQPLRNIVDTVVRIPVMLVGLVLGENAELLGLQTMQIGNSLLMLGSHNFGM